MGGSPKFTASEFWLTEDIVLRPAKQGKGKRALLSGFDQGTRVLDILSFCQACMRETRGILCFV